MQGPLPGLQSHFGQLGFRSADHGPADVGQRGLDVGSLSIGHSGLPPVRVSTGQVNFLSDHPVLTINCDFSLLVKVQVRLLYRSI